jgi:hypothetical protein
MHTFEGSQQEQGEKSQMKNNFLDIGLAIFDTIRKPDTNIKRKYRV